MDGISLLVVRYVDVLDDDISSSCSTKFGYVTVFIFISVDDDDVDRNDDCIGWKVCCG